MEFIGTRFRAHKMGVHVMCASVVVQFCVVTASAHMFGVAWLHARLSIWRLGCRRIGDSKNQTWDARASRRKISQHGSLGFLKPSGLVPAWLAQRPRSRAGAVSSTGPGRLPIYAGARPTNIHNHMCQNMLRNSAPVVPTERVSLSVPKCPEPMQLP